MNQMYMHPELNSFISDKLGGDLHYLLPFFIAAAVWTVVLKGFALWHAGRNGQLKWFIAILIINGFGILEIVYLVWFRKDKNVYKTMNLFDEENKGTVAE